jgi:hypothetical protein
VQHVRWDAELYNNNDADQGRDARHKLGVEAARNVPCNPEAQNDDINVCPARIYISLCAPASVIPVTTSREVSPQSPLERSFNGAAPAHMFDVDVYCRGSAMAAHRRFRAGIRRKHASEAARDGSRRAGLRDREHC